MAVTTEIFSGKKRFCNLEFVLDCSNYFLTERRLKIHKQIEVTSKLLGMGKSRLGEKKFEELEAKLSRLQKETEGFGSDEVKKAHTEAMQKLGRNVDIISNSSQKKPGAQTASHRPLEQQTGNNVYLSFSDGAGGGQTSAMSKPSLESRILDYLGRTSRDEKVVHFGKLTLEHLLQKLSLLLGGNFSQEDLKKCKGKFFLEVGAGDGALLDYVKEFRSRQGRSGVNQILCTNWVDPEFFGSEKEAAEATVHIQQSFSRKHPSAMYALCAIENLFRLKSAFHCPSVISMNTLSNFTIEHARKNLESIWDYLPMKGAFAHLTEQYSSEILSFLLNGKFAEGLIPVIVKNDKNLPAIYYYDLTEQNLKMAYQKTGLDSSHFKDEASKKKGSTPLIQRVDQYKSFLLSQHKLVLERSERPSNGPSITRKVLFSECFDVYLDAIIGPAHGGVFEIAEGKKFKVILSESSIVVDKHYPKEKSGFVNLMGCVLPAGKGYALGSNHRLLLQKIDG